MTLFLKSFLLGSLLYTAQASALASPPKVGFTLPDSVGEFSLTYQSFENLIVLSVVINDTPPVNLILDTGCRNIVLFGRQFKKDLSLMADQVVTFSGMGSGRPLRGGLALHNEVTIGAITGYEVPIVVVPNRNMFQRFPSIHGLIGYDIFTRFEVELNPGLQRITFRPGHQAFIPEGFTKISMRVEDARPIISSTLQLENGTIVSDMMVDTGSALGLLLHGHHAHHKIQSQPHELLGRGLNGVIKGVHTITHLLRLDAFEVQNVHTNIIHSPAQSYAYIGMGFLKDYTVILNYAQAYMCLRKIS